jgi:hypothetical protein
VGFQRPARPGSGKWHQRLDFLITTRAAQDIDRSLPNESILKYGDKAGTNGADIITYNSETGKVTLWDVKYRSNAVTLNDHSPTFTNPDRLTAAREEAIDIVKQSDLPPEHKMKAIEALTNPTRETVELRTVGAGKVKNSIVYNPFPSGT